MQLNLNSEETKNIFGDVRSGLKPEELGDYILKEMNAEDREKILKRIAVDKLLNQVVGKERERDQEVIPFSPEERIQDNKRLRSEIIYYLALCQFKGIGNSVLRKLLIEFRSLEKLYRSPLSALRERGVSRSIIKSLSDESLKEKSLDKAYEILNICKSEGINLLYLENEYFPNELCEDDTMPFLIFYKGDLSFIKRARKISMFGKRNASEFGVRAVNSLSSSLVTEGYTIVTNALTTAGTQSAFVSIQNNSPPVVVFPSSLDHATTKIKRRFINYVLDGGGLVTSVFYPGEPYTYRNILTSNKLQLLLSRAMVLIESDQTLATSQLVMSAKRFGKPIIIPVPPARYKGVNEEIVKLLKTDPTILPIHSRDEYYKIFDMLRDGDRK